uniref:PIH1 N-terminal domain-containing protein n=1 Tax=Pelagomonas calceolata TaxID=35677 RepID=A0A7S4E2F5_9STRA|mmetsp:Transcript_5982/g.14488  ORF Transcript_5982/g.14488 Transcript_5982/m.14488 type:complete len:442 (+) Transcript_5982:173-1498(+)
MNEARRQAARPGDFGGGPDGGRKLPNEVKAMARQMGISAKELSEVGDTMWARLTELSEKDPVAYAELMKESAKHVAKNAGEELAEEPDDAKANELMNRVLSPSVLTPVPGFVVKCQLKYGGGKVMVNICSHQAVVPPNDQRGKDATKYKAGISPRGLQIPLVVGRVRSCAVAGKASNTVAEGKAVDVLVHPWVMDQINGEGPRGGPWRAEIAALAVSWVAKETKLPLDSGWKHINSKYKGGLGKKSDEPVPFDIEEAQQQSKPPDERKKSVEKKIEKPEGVAASPAQLLKRARDLASKEEKENHVSLKLPTQKKSSKKPLVQEVDKDGAVVECTDEGFDISDDIDKSERKKKPAVKKGFLRTAKARKAALYPSGSEQGESQKEGTYSRFMSKCKVVDTTTMSKEEVDAATRQYAGTGTVSQPPQVRESASLRCRTAAMPSP